MSSACVRKLVSAKCITVQKYVVLIVNQTVVVSFLTMNYACIVIVCVLNPYKKTMCLCERDLVDRELVFKCETHKRRGWNLTNWQELRNVKILQETPKMPPYFHEDAYGKQITTCDLCQQESTLLDCYESACHVCNIYVCKNPTCVADYMVATEDVDYDYNCIPYYRKTAYPCPNAHEKQ